MGRRATWKKEVQIDRKEWEEEEKQMYVFLIHAKW